MSGEKIYRKPSRCGESGKESLTEEYGKGIPSRSRRFGIFVLMLALLIFQVTIFVYEKFSQNEDSVVVGSSQPLVEDVPFVFNPNTITLDSLCMLGLSPRQAQTIINYRSKGGRFRRPEDFSRMYVVSEELFLRLRPFIVIPSESSGTKQGVNVPKLEKTDSLGTKQGLNVPKFGKTDGSGTKQGVNVPKLEKSGSLGTKHGVNVPMFGKTDGLGTKQGLNMPKLEKSGQEGAKLMMVELNEADSSTLVTLYGIGPFYAQRIIEYRKRLGGFHSPEQLMEIPGIDSTRYGGVAKRVTADPLKIRRFRLDSAGKHFLINHPYIGAYAARGIILMREKMGKEFCTLENLVRERVISKEKADSLWPYVE